MNTALIIALLLPLAHGGQDPAPATTGTVTGTFTTTAKVTGRGTASQRDLVIYLVPKTTVTLPAPANGQVAQARLTFTPHVLPVQRGASVVFRNDDAVTHNVLLEAKCCATDRDMQKGDSATVTFPEAGVFPIACRLHPEMAMHVVVLDTAWFTHVELAKAKTDDGAATDRKAPAVHTATFTIAGVPPGEYLLKTWNKRLDAIESPVTVTAGAATAVDLHCEH